MRTRGKLEYKDNTEKIEEKKKQQSSRGRQTKRQQQGGNIQSLVLMGVQWIPVNPPYITY